MSSSSPTAARRYLVVTAVATPANVALTWALLAGTSWHALWCNLVAATALTIPTFVVCSAWVWPLAGPSVARASAFWISSLVNVGVASAAMWAAARAGAPDPVLALTPFAVYTVLWLVRFAFLDRIVFGRHPRGDVDGQPDVSAPTTV